MVCSHKLWGFWEALPAVLYWVPKKILDAEQDLVGSFIKYCPRGLRPIFEVSVRDVNIPISCHYITRLQNISLIESLENLKGKNNQNNLELPCLGFQHACGKPGLWSFRGKGKFVFLWQRAFTRNLSVENTDCNERKIFVSLLSIAKDDNLMSKKVQVKIYSSYASSMYKNYYFRRVLHPEQNCAEMGWDWLLVNIWIYRRFISLGFELVPDKMKFDYISESEGNI